MDKENLYRDLREICTHIDTTLFKSIADAQKTADILMSDKEKEAKKTKNYNDQFICKLPLQVRIEILIYVFAEKKDSEIDWDNINKILSTNVDPLDYNLYERALNMDGLRKVLKNIVYSVEKESVWQGYTCSNCYSKYFLSIGEVRFYKVKGITPVKRCHCCLSDDNGKLEANRQNYQKYNNVY